MGVALRTTLAAACFFLQAEDGIRDYKVTGVQTCALPILELGCGGRISRAGLAAAALGWSCSSCGAGQLLARPGEGLGHVGVLAAAVDKGLIGDRRGGAGDAGGVHVGLRHANGPLSGGAVGWAKKGGRTRGRAAFRRGWARPA